MVENRMILLDTVELVPVVELDPSTFATRDRPPPPANGPDQPAAWTQYWHDSLADGGVVGVEPLRPASWFVTVPQLRSPGTLGKILVGLLRSWGGTEALADPDGPPVLSGGLVLCHAGEILVEPGCCCDLGDLAEWKTAAAYRGLDWKMVWIGHPWVSARFDGNRLVLSEPHESAVPVDRWAVRPADLEAAVAAAQVVLEGLACDMQILLCDMGVRDARAAARTLAGLG